jgi:CRP-like cAMP-binding protein
MFVDAVVHSPAGTGPRDRDARVIDGVVSGLPLFRGVDRARIALVAAQSQVLQCRRGTTIVRHGERVQGIIAIAYGMAKIVLPRSKGEGKVLRFLGANESFGEAAVILGRECPVDVVTLDEAMLVLVPPQALLRLFDQDAQFARNVARLLADKCIRMVGEIDAVLQQSAMQRLAAYLSSLAEPNGTPETGLVRLPASKTAIAARLGIKKETMSRLLRELADRGLIAVERREIEVRNLPELARVAR